MPPRLQGLMIKKSTIIYNVYIKITDKNIPIYTLFMYLTVGKELSMTQKTKKTKRAKMRVNDII